MKLYIQSDYKKQLENLINDLCVEFKNIQLSDLNEASLVVGDQNFYQQHPNLPNSVLYRILIHTEANVDSDLLLNHQIRSVLRPEQIKQDQLILNQVLEQAQQIEYGRQVRIEVQQKRKVLEDLNEQLRDKGSKQLESLVLSHEEESRKNQNEKLLLHFLDFIRSESLRDDFISVLLKFLWKDLKKISPLYLLGFCIEETNSRSYFINYDGELEKIVFVEKPSLEAIDTKNMATTFGRPVGKVLSWSLPEFSKKSLMFIESVQTQLPEKQIHQYIKERLSLISIYLDRWMIEKEFKMLVEKWDQTFDAFSGYVHVIDDEYVIQKANYIKTVTIGEEKQYCYQVLAGRSSPCVHCPVKTEKSSEFYIKDNKRVKANSSSFELNGQQYHFVTYEDLTALDQLKTQIIQTEKMSALGRLGNHLSHEINNPLTGLKSYIQLIQSNSKSYPLTPTMANDLNEVLKATQRSEKIISNLLSFAQESSVQLEIGFFQEVLDNTLTLLKSALRKHRLFVDLKKDPIEIDKQGLQQVLFNIIKNSCQAMDKDGIIKIFQEVTSSHIIYTIEDNGPGLSNEIKENLFLPFMTTKKEGEGTGLGLYLSRRLMDRMGAELKIDTECANGFKAQLTFKRILVK